MKITCPKCKTKMLFPDDKLKPEQTKIKCGNCGAVLVYKRKPSDSSAETVPTRAEETETPATAEFQSGQAARTEHTPEEKEHPDELKHIEQRPEQKAPAPDFAPSDEIRSALRDIQAAPPAKKQAVAKKPAHLPSPSDMKSGRPTGKIIMIAAAGGLAVIALVLLFFFRTGPDTPKSPPVPSAQAPGTSAVQAPAQTPEVQNGSQAGKLPDSSLPAASTAQQSASGPPYFDMTEDKAIELVKKSDVLVKSTSVESIVRKWVADNAAGMTVVGWQAKKFDDQKYMVSYTAVKGDKPTGFYFELDASTGVVQDLARYPELQKKYNVQYNK